MNLNVFERLGAGARIGTEADRLERELGPDRAVEMIREQIAQADRDARRRLYRLHDAIARRHGPGAARA